jgi:hypothetical protein
LIFQWLYSLGNVDIHAENEYAFRYGCLDGHLLLPQWLYSFEGISRQVLQACLFAANNATSVTIYTYIIGIDMYCICLIFQNDDDLC